MSKKIMNFQFSQKDAEVMVRHKFFSFEGEDIKISPFFNESLKLFINKKMDNRLNDLALIKLNLERQGLDIENISPGDLHTIESLLSLFFADLDKSVHTRQSLERWL